MSRATAAELTPVGPGLPPLCGDRAEVLILGSFPSPKSRAQGFYYGHPQNRFWPLMAALFGEVPPAWEDLDAKRSLATRHGIAIWDVIASCKIRGASDASIRDAVPNEIAALAATLGVRAVFCNGTTAGRLYEKYCRQAGGPAATVLPSTSPANAAWTPARLQSAWGPALAPWLPDMKM